jgi:hypothetical protein
MGMAILGDVLRSPALYESDMIVYVPEDAPDVNLFTKVLLLQHGAYGDDDVRGYRYLLETGVMAEVVNGLSQQLGGPPTAPQSLRAVLYYAEHDAFPDLNVVK